MANQEQLKRLRQGIATWNPWRQQQPPDFQPDLSRANFRRANLFRADLRGADLNGANLKEANLSSADLSRAHLNNADLRGADLRGANLNGADLSGAHLRGADLSHARVGGMIFGNLDLRTVKGLETVHYAGPSTIGTDTIERSQGDLPEAFLRGAGLSETSIAYAHSLKSHAIEYYTCFISYSSQDTDFATRLHADLRQQGVRCWLALEDLNIDESIRLHDKLLLMLSRHSVNSAWVEREVMAALEKEQDYQQLVLFPITLDEQVMQTNLPWDAHLRRSRHIGDFSAWKDHTAYQKAFTRLLRDLQAAPSPPRAP